MKCACSFTPVLALVGLVGLGVGGYNLMSTGCPLGGCGETAATANVVAASETTAMDCCAGMDKAECETKMACCESEKGAADIQTVANTTEKAAEDCAKECSTKSCEEKLAAGECPHAVKTSEGKETCPMHPEAVATKSPK